MTTRDTPCFTKWKPRYNGQRCWTLASTGAYPVWHPIDLDLVSHSRLHVDLIAIGMLSGCTQYSHNRFACESFEALNLPGLPCFWVHPLRPCQDASFDLTLTVLHSA